MRLKRLLAIFVAVAMSFMNVAMAEDAMTTDNVIKWQKSITLTTAKPCGFVVITSEVKDGCTVGLNLKIRKFKRKKIEQKKGFVEKVVYPLLQKFNLVSSRQVTTNKKTELVYSTKIKINADTLSNIKGQKKIVFDLERKEEAKSAVRYNFDGSVEMPVTKIELKICKGDTCEVVLYKKNSKVKTFNALHLGIKSEGSGGLWKYFGLPALAIYVVGQVLGVFAAVSTLVGAGIGEAAGHADKAAEARRNVQLNSTHERVTNNDATDSKIQQNSNWALESIYEYGKTGLLVLCAGFLAIGYIGLLATKAGIYANEWLFEKKTEAYAASRGMSDKESKTYGDATKAHKHNIGFGLSTVEEVDRFYDNLF